MILIRKVLVLLVIFSALNLDGQVEPPNPLYAQGTFSTMQDAPAIHEMGFLLKQAGYQGMESWGIDNFQATVEALEKNNLPLAVLYLPLYVNSYEEFPLWVAETKSTIRDSPKGTLFCFHIPEIETETSQRAVRKMVVEVLLEMALYAQAFEVNICTYPHVGSYCETVEESMKYAKAVNRSNCGAMLTLCHLFKVEGSKKINRTLKKSKDYLFAITISGADKGHTKEMTWDQLIQPLGEGSFDMYHFLKQLWDMGYEGPVGVQFFGINGDARMVIKSSALAWNQYWNRYLKETDYGSTR